MTQTSRLPPAFYEISPPTYWCDFLLSTFLGWASFVAAVTQPVDSLWGAVALLTAMLALNRAAVFTHEISHQGRRLPGFEATWNVLVGFPLLIPTFLYGRVHLDHHQVAKYGTPRDPSYLPFARSIWLIAAYLGSSSISPALLIIRFLALGPIGFYSKCFEKWMLERFSAISVNPAYRREVTPHLVRMARSQTRRLYAFWLISFAVGIAAIQSHFETMLAGSILSRDILPLRLISIWYLVSVAISLLEALRTLSEHAYENAGAPMDKAAQIADSTNIPGGILTELWSPLALHYHATHHAFPGVPYHQLPGAYRHLAEARAADFQKTTQPSLIATLKRLCKRACQPQRGP